MNKEDFIKMYKKDKKEEIIEELFYKCNANYKYKEVLDKIKEYVEYNACCLHDEEILNHILELLEEIE